MIDVPALGAFCSALAAIAVVIGWMVKPIRNLTKELSEIRKELVSVKKEAKDNSLALEKQEKVNELHMKTQYVILEHLQTNNATGKMAKCSEELKDYLITTGSSIH